METIPGRYNNKLNTAAAEDDVSQIDIAESYQKKEPAGKRSYVFLGFIMIVHKFMYLYFS